MPGGALRAVPHSASSTADRLAAHLSEFAEPRPANSPDTFVRLWSRPTATCTYSTSTDHQRAWPGAGPHRPGPPGWELRRPPWGAYIITHHRRCAGLLLWALAGWTWTVLAVALGVTVDRPFKILKLIS